VIVALIAAIAQQGPAFVDMTASLGLVPGDSAACWADLDNDGWTDLATGGAVWMNEGGRKFVRRDAVGSVVAADFDNDGYADLFSWSQMQLFQNRAGKTLATFPLPELPPTVSRGACWGDFNCDGFVDLYVGGYEDWENQKTYPDLLLMNKGGTGFELAWSETRYRARGVTVCDFDRDGDLDVYVSNYRLQPNLLWLNDGRGTFSDAAAARGAQATSKSFEGGHSIGAAWGDFDDDGEFDLFAGNFAHVDSRGDQPKSRFLRNTGSTGGYKFEDRGTCGVFYQESYASPAAGDFDNDGDLDLYFTTVYASASFGKKNNPVLFRNDGGFKFVDVTAETGLSELGATYQAVWSDFDHDGDLDLATNGKLFVNKSQPKHWLEVRLKGDGKSVNKSAVGTQVRIRLGDRILTRQAEAGTGEGNQNDSVLHFGLGAHSKPLDLVVNWPGGKTQRIKGVRTNQVFEVVYKD
jgi:hypothetical protein